MAQANGCGLAAAFQPSRLGSAHLLLIYREPEGERVAWHSNLFKREELLVQGQEDVHTQDGSS